MLRFTIEFKKIEKKIIYYKTEKNLLQIILNAIINKLLISLHSVFFSQKFFIHLKNSNHKKNSLNIYKYYLFLYSHNTW